MSSKKKIYLPGLNGIRAIAALAVVISHVNGHLESYGLKSIRYWDLAGFGVTIFFSLSGFLITYLLLKEKEKSGTINIKKFYLRRILRIWPLYYTYLLIVLLVIGYSAIGKTIIYHLFIIPNFSITSPWSSSITAMGAFLIGHYWSLGVEEQFYSSWPWIIRKIKKLLPFLIIFPIIFFLIKVLAKFLQAPEEIIFILHYSRFGCLAIGGLGAYLFYKEHPIINYVKNFWVQLTPWILLAIIAFNKFHIFSIIDHEIVSIFIVILIVGQITKSNRLFNLENKVFDYLGKISFGIYVFNPLSIYLLSLFFKKYYSLSNNIFNYILVYFLVILFNIILAHISYYSLEKYFLKLKRKFVTVNSVSSRGELKN